MSIRCIISIREHHAFIAGALQTYIGHTARNNDYTSIIIGLFEYVLSDGNLHFKKEAVEEIHAYGSMGMDDAEDIFNSAIQGITFTLQHALGYGYSDHLFEISPFNHESLMFTEMGQIFHKKDSPSNEFDQWVSSVQNDIDNGAWVSERYRRALGI